MHGMIARNDLALGPLYKRVKMLLTESLAAGEWKPSQAIPSEARLAQQFDVSIGTVRKAIDELVAEKILIRQQGRGTFVAAHSQDRFLYHFFHIVGVDGVKRFPTTELLSFSKERGDAEMAQRLNLPRNSRVIRICNLLRVEGEPVEVDEIYISAAAFPDLTREVFERRPGTIYQLYQDRYGINVIHTTEHLRAGAASADDAALLALAEGAPVLEIERTAFTYSDTPIELRKSRINTTRHVYLNDLAKTP
jgi:GntR family transcriptional regulator